MSNHIKGTIAEYDSMVGFARSRKINEGLKLLCYGVAAGAVIAFLFGWGKRSLMFADYRKSNRG